MPVGDDQRTLVRLLARLFLDAAQEELARERDDADDNDPAVAVEPCAAGAGGGEV